MKASYHLSKVIIIVVLLSFTFGSCKKENVITYEFIYTGIRCVNDTIFFSATKPTGSSFLWNFGDGQTATTSTPVHQYSTAGTYTITLTINNNTSHVINTTITIFNNPLYTHLITGTKLWHHDYIETADGSPGPYIDTINYSDTSFAVNYIDPLTISIGSDTLTYTGSQDSVLVFEHDYYYDGHPTFSFDNVYFNYISNSILFSRFDHISAAGYSYENYTTP